MASALALTVLEAALQTGVPLATKAVVDRLVTDSRSAWLPAALLAALFVSAQVVEVLVSALRPRMSDRLTRAAALALMEKAESLNGLASFESGELHDTVTFVDRESRYRPLHAVNHSLSALSEGGRLLGAAALQLWYAPVSAVVFLAAAAPFLVGQLALEDEKYRMLREQSPRYRRLSYLMRLATRADSAKEIRLFGMSGFLERSYEALVSGVVGDLARQRARHLGRTAAAIALGAGGMLVAFGLLPFEASRHAAAAGVTVLFVTAALQAHEALLGVTAAAQGLGSVARFLSEYHRLAVEPPSLRSGAERLPTAIAPPEMRAAQVTFSYGSGGQDALGGVSLDITPGTTVALVGENGAGKSSLAKLLVRLYDPGAGRVERDGRPLSEYDLDDLRRGASVLFQDFAKLPLTLRENVRVASLDAPDEASFARAIALAGLDPVAERLPHSLDTMLGRTWGGAELSHGEWQRVALARAAFREAGLLVLDEPTSAIDPNGERQLLDGFRTLCRGRTVVLISHRLAFARELADRIVVLRNGEIADAGTHEELLAREGPYRDLWMLQSRRYGS